MKLPKISVITPSIRPHGLEVVFKSLRSQTFQDFEWLPRLSIPKEKSDLCYQVNRALREAKGELIVFVQDYITLSPEGLFQMWQRYLDHPKSCFTAPVVKTDKEGNRKEDWRPYWKHREGIPFDHWEIDFGSAPRSAFFEDGLDLFDERYDEGFGWENVDLAYRFEKKGYNFMVDTTNIATAFDHDAYEEHPYKKRPNLELWAKKKAMYDENL